MSFKWKIDPARSKIQFRVKDKLITTLTGYFNKFSLVVETETEDFNTTKKIEFTADVNSIETHNRDRDADLRSAIFFNAAAYPQLRFSTEGYSSSGDSLKGNLTIQGITRPVTFLVDFSGIGKDEQGHIEANLSLEGKLSRREFDLNWPVMTPAGYSAGMSDEVKIHAEVRLVEQSQPD